MREFFRYLIGLIIGATAGMLAAMLAGVVCWMIGIKEKSLGISIAVITFLVITAFVSFRFLRPDDYEATKGEYSKYVKIGLAVFLIYAVYAIYQKFQEGDPLYQGSMMFFGYFILVAIIIALYATNIETLHKYTNGSQFPKIVVMIIIFAAAFYTGIFAPYLQGAERLVVFFSPLPIMLLFTYINDGTWTSIGKQKETEEKKEAIRKAYNNKGWATKGELTLRLESEILPIHIGANYYWGEQGNICTVGGARGGKGVNLVLPALLDQYLKFDEAHSFIVLDPKGENCAVSASYLKSIGYKVHVINPFEIKEIAAFGNARINPFDMFNVYTPDFAKYMDMIAFALIPTSTKADATWDNAGRQLIKCYIGHMMSASDEPKTFKTLYDWMHYAGKQRHDLLLEMSKNMAFEGIVAAGAMSIIGHLDDDAGKMVAGMYQAAQDALTVFGDLQLRHTVSGSDFSLQDITQQKTAVFVCVNPDDLRRVSVWMRIVFNSILDNLPRFYNSKRKTVIIMDEFASIGRLQSFEDNFSYLPGYNVVLWPIVQTLTQLKTHYPNNWETFLGNAIVRHYLAIGDNFTAEYISKRMPKRVEFVGSHRDGSPREIQQPLLDVDGVLTFRDIILEVKGLPSPAWLAKLPYWERNDHGSPNPFRG